MKAISLESVFTGPLAEIAPLRSLLRRSRPMSELRHALGSYDFLEAYDFFRSAAAEAIERGEIDRAITTLTEIDALITRNGTEENDRRILDMHAALMQILTALYIEKDDEQAANDTAAATLNLLAQESNRKDEAFLSILGSLLYDIGFIHAARKEYKQAERELDKAVKIFERLAKIHPERYAPAHVMTVNSATATYRNRLKQAEMLAHYQAATSTYQQMVSAGVAEATGRLIDSLVAEGDTLARMGRHREAMQYYSRALKSLTRIEPEFSLRQLRLSIALGESMLKVRTMKEKGVHLLNTMLHKATKINATDEHRAIVDILVNARTSKLDILGLWHKMFPR